MYNGQNLKPASPIKVPHPNLIEEEEGKEGEIKDQHNNLAEDEMELTGDNKVIIESEDSAEGEDRLQRALLYDKQRRSMSMLHPSRGSS